MPRKPITAYEAALRQALADLPEAIARVRDASERKKAIDARISSLTRLAQSLFDKLPEDKRVVFADRMPPRRARKSK